MYMPQKPNKAAKAFWAKWKGKLQAKPKPVQVPPKPAKLAPSDPVAFLLQKILEGTRQEQMVNLQDPAGQLLIVGCISSKLSLLFDCCKCSCLFEAQDNASQRGRLCRRAPSKAWHTQGIFPLCAAWIEDCHDHHVVLFKRPC